MFLCEVMKLADYDVEIICPGHGDYHRWQQNHPETSEFVAYLTL